MRSSRPLVACVTLFLVAAPPIARAGSGDPRLVNGVVEWPGVVNNEPFLVVRGDDGVLYYVGISATRRGGPVTAGSRISVLGLEGRSPHEITAVGIGSGPSAEAALARLQGAGSPAPLAPPPSLAPVAPALPTATAAPANETITPPAPAPKAPGIPSSRQPGAPSPKSATTDGRASAAAADAAVVPASTTPVVEVTKAQPAIVPTAPMLAPADDKRWVELVGEVEALVGRTLVLKVDGGRVSVDVSGLRAHLAQIVVPGSMVKVYGVPVELRFKAMGFIDPDVRAQGRPPR